MQLFAVRRRGRPSKELESVYSTHFQSTVYSTQLQCPLTRTSCQGHGGGYVLFNPISKADAGLLTCLRAMQAQGFVDCCSDLLDRSSWVLNPNGVNKLGIGIGLKPADRKEWPLMHPVGPVRASWTPWEHLHFLLTSGWALSHVAKGTRKKSLIPFEPGSPEPSRLIYYRDGKCLPRWYIACLAMAHAGDLHSIPVRVRPLDSPDHVIV